MVVFPQIEQLKDLKQEFMKQEQQLIEVKKNSTTLEKKLEYERFVVYLFFCNCLHFLNFVFLFISSYAGVSHKRTILKAILVHCSDSFVNRRSIRLCQNSLSTP